MTIKVIKTHLDTHLNY